MQTSAQRIVEIQSKLSESGAPVARLLTEQRLLWNRDHEGRSFDDVAEQARYDAWMVKR